MYDAPFDTATRLGWALSAAVVVLLVARAVRTEARARRPCPRPTAVRVLDAGLLAVLVAAVVALLAALVVIVAGASA